MNRKGEQEKTWFRSDRFFCVGNQWYICTRENPNVGPFRSREEALKALPSLFGRKQSFSNINFNALKMSTTGVWGVNNYV